MSDKNLEDTDTNLSYPTPPSPTRPPPPRDAVLALRAFLSSLRALPASAGGRRRSSRLPACGRWERRTLYICFTFPETGSEAWARPGWVEPLSKLWASAFQCFFLDTQG